MENIQNTLSGKMSLVHLAVMKGMTLKPCLKKSQKPVFQYLQAENGVTPEWLEAAELQPLGDCSTLNIGEYPNEESESILSEVLEVITPPKYYLSATACSGILRRAERRKKKLPPDLEKALKQQIEYLMQEETEGGDISPTITGDHCSRINDYAPIVLENSVIYSAGFNGQNSVTAASVDYMEEKTPPIIKSKYTNVLCLNDQGGSSTTVESGQQSPTLRAQTHGNLPIVVYCLQGSMIGRADKNGPQGNGINKNVSFTVNTTDRHAVVYALDRASFNQGINAQYDFEITDSGINSTVVAKGPSAVAYKMLCRLRWVIRRLTPLECERLQGYPDFWTCLKQKETLDGEEFDFWRNVMITDKKIKGKKCNEYPTPMQITRWYNKLECDGNRYKALGNSLAIPCALRVIGYIAKYEAQAQMLKNIKCYRQESLI